jgi:hypothetical protein
MAERAEDPTVTEADRAFSDAVITLRDAVPAELRGQVLDLESAASAWGVALAESYFWGGVALGLNPPPGKKPVEPQNGKCAKMGKVS